MTDGHRYHRHLLYLDRLHDKVDRSKAEDDARRGSNKKGNIIRVSSTVVKRPAK